MFLEAVSRSIRYRLADGRELVLRPGAPVEIPERSAKHLLTKAGGKVRIVPQPQSKPDWQAAWRTLARMTDGIVKEDPRFPLIMAALDRCDVAYLANDWAAFQRAAEQVRHGISGGA